MMLMVLMMTRMMIVTTGTGQRVSSKQQKAKAGSILMTIPTRMMKVMMLLMI